MKSLSRYLCLALALAPVSSAADPLKGYPYQNETLHYTVNWPSGLSLGEAAMTAHKVEGGWNFDVSLSAGVPGFSINDVYKSAVTTEGCSQKLERDIVHGKKKNGERTTFDQKKGVAERQTITDIGGGKSELQLPTCARDAIAFQYFARQELGQGRVPPTTRIFFGSGYTVRMDYVGATNITLGTKTEVTDQLSVGVKGPSSDFTFTAFYARDAARTPLRVKIPVTVGTITLELVR